jgi:hypothetical protein
VGLVGLIVLVLTAPVTLVGSATSAPVAPRELPTARPSVAPAASATLGLPGAEGGGRYASGPELFRADHSFLSPGVAPNRTVPAPLVEGALGPPVAAPRPPTTGSHPSTGFGWLSGTVEDSVYGTPLANVGVSLTGSPCANCTSAVTTNSTGQFVVEGAAGPSAMTFLDLPNYLVNKTYPTVVAGVTTPLGVVLLVHLATVEGRVLADVAGTPPLGNVTVLSVSRDEQVGGPNITQSLPNGTFVLPVDPFPIEVEFSTTAPFLPNETYADPTPWQVVELGTVYLEGGINASITVVDSLTGLPVVAEANYCSERIDQGCFPQQGGNGTFQIPTVAGPGTVMVQANGYVTNITEVPDVPADPTGVPDLGTVRLLPMGSIEVSLNFSGGTPNGSWPSALTSESPGLSVVACSLSGMDPGGLFSERVVPPSCVDTPVSLGTTELVPAPPLRDLILIQRTYHVPDGFPVAEIAFNGGVPTIPNASLVNDSWANVTPDHVTYVGSMNISAGTYLYGSVGVPGNDSAASISVQVCSTVRGSACLKMVSTGATGQAGPDVAGCPYGPWEFCVPAPPGPDVVSVDWGTTENSTWITVPFGCCSQEDHPTNLGAIDGVFQFSGGGGGTVTGTVGLEGAPASYTPPFGWDLSISVCPAGAVYPCYDGSTNGSGNTFSLSAPLGWDVVTVAGRGYRTNTSWVDVTGNNSTGPIDVGRVSSFGGQVVSSVTGDPVLEASVSICAVEDPEPCYPGTMTSGSNGTFNGTVPALPFPAGTFEFLATASGYDPEGAFVNVTPGGFVQVPTIRMPPIGGAGGDPVGPFAARGANSSSPTTGSWVIGRAVDAVTGLGVGNAEVTVCEIVTAAGCALTSTQTDTGGGFNLTTVHGAYEVWINGTHYDPHSVYLNASSAGTVDLGRISIYPLDRISGRVLIDPWESLFGAYGEGANGVSLTACTPALFCGPLAVTASDGSFNVTAPAGTPDTLHLIGGGPAGQYGNTLNGYNASGLAIDVSTPFTTLNGSGPGNSVSLKILGGITGNLHESVGAAIPPAYFADYAVNPPGAVGGATGYWVGGGGFYAAFLPDGWTGVRTTAVATGLVPTTSAPYSGTVQPGLVAVGPNLTVARFGFVTATLLDAHTHAPLLGIALYTFGGGPGNATLGASADSNGLGFVNVTAPPGTDAVSTSAVAYATYTGLTTVVSGATDAIGTINLTALANGGFATLRSVEVNANGAPPTPGAFDNVTVHPVEGLEVVENAGLGVSSVPAFGNDLGQYFVDAVPAPDASVTFSAPGYTSLHQNFNFTAGRDVVEPQLNLTANGLLAGTVTAEPGNVSVAYASVVVCAQTDLSCTNEVETNATGVFWIAAPAGIDEVSVQSALYLSNISKLVNVTPDTFTELGNVPVFTFGTVSGVVRALPHGELMVGVNVSLCSKFSRPGDCLADETVTTDANGSFSIQTPPGTYYLYADAPGYNASRFLLVVGPGVNLNVGTLFLQAFGTVTGEVVNTTGVPVANATVLPCPTYAGPCTGVSITNTNGMFALTTSPGPSSLTASAPGYVDTSEVVDVISGGTVRADPVVLTPIPPDVFENVSGVVTAAASGVGLPNALVVAEEAGSRVAQTVSGAGGDFRFEVRWGTVEVVAGEPDYRSENTSLIVHSNVTGVDFALEAMTYLVEGITSDGGTGTILTGVEIANNGTVVARSDANGLYQLQLPNGTTTLTASYETNGTIQYGTIQVPILVAGASVVHDIALPRTEVPLRGVVVDASTGRPLPSASVTLWTSTGRGEGSRSTDASGEFTFGTGPGTYNVSVSAPGFEAANVTVSTGVAGNYTTVSLVPIARNSGNGGLSPVEVAVLAGGVVAVGAAAFVAVRAGRRRPPPDEPDAEEMLPVYEEPEPPNEP